LCGAKDGAAEHEGQLMESKGRRAPRAAGRIAAPDEPVQPIEFQAAPPEPAEPPSEPPEPATIVAKAAENAETALDVVTAAETAAAQPSLAPFAPAAEPAAPADRPRVERNPFAALAQSQAALARGLGALSAEMAGMALSGIDTAARTATQMLSVKTLSDAIAVNAGLTCSSFDTLIGGSAKLSEIGVKLAAEAARPILSQFGSAWLPPTSRGIS
jgi:hypothetical protein